MIIDIINKKREGKVLSREELETIFLGYLDKQVPDYQMSAFLMAICINGMSDEEVFTLTDIFLKSGEQLDLSFLDGIKVDKHSTGGVGDKTTLIIGPMVASCHVPFIKMSGRALGYTGGTIDKLESIDGISVDLSIEQIKKQASEIGLVITSQTKNLTPLDKVVYALRDVSGTTQSIPLIASSIMSKKIAGGADKILIDVKIGRGALLKTEEEGKRLISLLVKIGENYNKEVRCILSPMDAPLGSAIGNKLEVLEAIEVLRGKKKGPLLDTCVNLASHLVSMGKNIEFDKAQDEVLACLHSGKCYQKFQEFITYQKGSLEKLNIEDESYDIKAYKSGVLVHIDALECAKFAFSLGTGRTKKEEEIDQDAGLLLCKEENMSVLKGEVIAKVYTKKEDIFCNEVGMFEIS